MKNMKDHLHICYCTTTIYKNDWYLVCKSSRNTEKRAVPSNLGLNAEGLLAAVTAEEQYGKWPTEVQEKRSCLPETTNKGESLGPEQNKNNYNIKYHKYTLAPC